MNVSTLEKLPFTEFQIALMTQALDHLEASGVYTAVDKRTQIRSLAARLRIAKSDGITRREKKVMFFGGKLPAKATRPLGRPPREISGEIA